MLHCRFSVRPALDVRKHIYYHKTHRKLNQMKFAIWLSTGLREINQQQYLHECRNDMNKGGNCCKLQANKTVA